MNKPDDVSAEAWGTVKGTLFTDGASVTDDQVKKWGLVGVTTELARAIDAAIAKERERVDKAGADRDRLVEALRKIAAHEPNAGHNRNLNDLIAVEAVRVATSALEGL